MVDYIKDPGEEDYLESWDGVEGLIALGAEDKFGLETSEFLREANARQVYMKKELLRRYGLIGGESGEPEPELAVGL
jgi:hypothetical protein